MARMFRVGQRGDPCDIAILKLGGGAKRLGKLMQFSLLRPETGNTAVPNEC